MNEPPISRLELWRSRWRRVRAWGRRVLPFASGVAAALVAILLYDLVVPAPHLLTQQDVNNTVADMMASATPPSAFSARVFQVIRPSLVLVQSTAPSGSGFAANEGVGSGVIVNDTGDILTSLHLVADVPYIYVTFADGSLSTATLIAAQADHDIGVLRPDKPPQIIVPATLGNPNAMRVGDEAYVVGNPFSLYGSMSAGVISGFGRTFQVPNGGPKLDGLIQVDAAVNPGNSGGPLVNRYGQVVGIVTALLNPTGQNFFVGVGFAVPIDVAGGAAGSPPV
jgi:S1-C subfamily serine protease